MIVELEQAADPARFGGKAAALARLRAAGLPVPAGFVIPAEALAGQLEALGLRAALEALPAEGPALEGAAAALQGALRQAALPAPLRAALAARLAGKAGPLAVRSSSAAEDLAEASFAGQYETVLGVRGLEEAEVAVRRCWASYFAPRALAYARRRGLWVGAGGAVLVQRLVEAEAAGVAFTLDPRSGSPDRVVINASFGLGEAVVSGQVTPDTFAVEKASGALVERALGDKRLRIDARPGGSAAAEVEPARRALPSLTDAEVGAVAALALRVEALEGRAVDIEWASARGEVHLLQARPVTAAGPRATALPPPDWAPELNTPIPAAFPVFANGNISEILPGCLTPLSWSLVGPALEKGFRTLGESLGTIGDVGPGPVVVGFFFHRPYLNVSYFQRLAENTPGSSPDSVLEELVGKVDNPRPAWSWRDLSPLRIARGLSIYGKAKAQQNQLAADVEALRAEFEAYRAKLEADPPATWPLGRLVGEGLFTEAEWRLGVIHIRASQFAVSSLNALRGMTARWLGDADGALAGTLVTGIGSLASADPAAGLHGLARVVLAEPELQAAFAAQPNDAALLAALRGGATAAARRFAAELEGFLARFGHRGLSEVDIAAQSWGQAPAPVLRHVRAYLAPSAASPAEVLARQQAAAEAARKDALARVSSLRRGLLAAVIDDTRRFIAAREEMKDLVVRNLSLSRRLLAAVQDRLLERGLLARADDVHYLLRDEIPQLARGELAPAEAARRVARRRQDHAWAQAVAVPRVQEGQPRWLAAEEPVAPAGRLGGLGVSAGRVEGPARVALSLEDAAALQPGEILVARVTDLAWTPHFLHARGLVVEVGGLLSHGSIVAREYGLPAVVGVAGATRAIRSGQRIAIDGGSGTVSLLE